MSHCEVQILSDADNVLQPPGMFPLGGQYPERNTSATSKRL